VIQKAARLLAKVLKASIYWYICQLHMHLCAYKITGRSLALIEFLNCSKNWPFKWLARLPPDGGFIPSMDSALIHQLGDFKNIKIYRSFLADWVQLPLDTPVYPAAFKGTFICRERSLLDEDCFHLCIVIQHLHHKMAKVGRYSIAANMFQNMASRQKGNTKGTLL
jgi:hypothetical protein